VSTRGGGHQAGRLDRPRHRRRSGRAAVVALPDSVAVGVRSLMKDMGLVYGALDFVTGSDGWTDAIGIVADTDSARGGSEMSGSSHDHRGTGENTT
jgi:hypothetical protein